METRKTAKDEWVRDVEFVLSECMRYQNMLDAAKPGELSKLASFEDWVCQLPSASGRGQITCGALAFRRLRNLALIAETQSNASGTVDSDKVFQALQRIVIKRFIKEARPITSPQVERAMASSVREAKRECADTTHYLPCRLTYADKPSSFNIGSVRFLSRSSFEEVVEPLLAEHASKNADHYNDLLIQDAKHYYSGFSWVAEVKVLSCAYRVSVQRARLAVTAALDILHILLGSYHTNRMAVGGPRLEEDRRAHMVVNENGRLHVSWSQAATSAVGFEDGWIELFDSPNVRPFLDGAAKAIEPLVDPSVDRPLALKYVDAAAWFGDAVREQSDSARIVKAVSGLERLVLTGEKSDITNLVCDRAAAIHSLGKKPSEFEATRDTARKLYALRSDLVHGSISPFDPYVSSCGAACMTLVEQVLSNALVLFHTSGLFNKPRTDVELAHGFNRIVDAAREEIGPTLEQSS